MTERNPYKADVHATIATPLTVARPIGWLRRLIRGVLLAIAGWVQGHPVWPYPLEQFFALEDRPGRCYIWTLNRNMTPEDAQAVAAAFHEEFTRKFHREPRALHIVTPDIEGLRRLTKEDAERFIVPWLRKEE